MRTRTRLIDAARTVVGRKGIEATTIADITDEADLGFGTFYNYFPSKEAVLEAASAVATEELGRALDELIADIDDPAEVIAVCVRHCVRMVDDDPIWAWFAVHTNLYQSQMSAAHGPRLARDVQRGIDSGRFPERNLPLMMHATGAVVLAALRARLTNQLAEEADGDVAAAVLRILGVPAAEARAIATRPLPAIRPQASHPKERRR